jgi:hypothetical protein
MKAKLVVLLLLAGSGLGCGPTVFTPHLYDPTTLPRVARAPLKVHLKSGELVVFESWKLSAEGDALTGTGTRYTPLRDAGPSGTQTIEIESVALLETNDRKQVSGLATGGLSTMTAVFGALSIACLSDPKSCFGSCPTFYLEDDPHRPAAEGFSSSIARALEARDVDALEGAHPRRGLLSVSMRNEAWETHAVRRVRLLSVPRPVGTRIFATRDGGFLAMRGLVAPATCLGPEGDCREPLALADRIERSSPTDPDDLAAREEVELFFPDAPARAGLVIRARQSLVTTFLFYQTLAYMGHQAGDWLAAAERSGPEGARQLLGMGRVLGGIEVDVPDGAGGWRPAGLFDEAGPIAGDVQVVPLTPRPESGPLTLRLRMAKGLWRIDQVALGEVGEALEATAAGPVAVDHAGRADPSALASLRAGRGHLVALPGDEYRLTFAVPGPPGSQSLFLESEGYYYEWMREEWLREEDPDMVALILMQPEEALRRLAAPFKAREAGAEETFWASRFGR